MDRHAYAYSSKTLKPPPPTPSGIFAMIALLFLACNIDGLDPGSSVRHVFFYTLAAVVIRGCMLELYLGKASYDKNKKSSRACNVYGV